MSKRLKIVKFKVCSQHKACSFCHKSNIPVIMEIKTGKAICKMCIDGVAETMKGMDNDSNPT